MKKEIIGYTRFGREIPLFRSEKGRADVLVVGGVHAREHITGDLIRLLMEENANIDCIPVLNIDGAELVKNGSASVSDRAWRKELIRLNGGEDFSQWKANGVGVDINVNFDADWGEGEKNATKAGPSDYIGAFCESEPETHAVCEAIRRGGYSLVIAYHTLGEEVYWGYEWNYRHYEQAKRAAEKLGYPLKRSEKSCGGLKDWYSLHFDGLGLTIEVGKDEWGHPCPNEKLKELYLVHRGSFALWEEIGGEIARKIHERGDKTGTESL